MKNFLMSVLGISAVLTLSGILFPKGTTEKTFKYAVGIFALVAVISSVQNIGFKDFNIFDETALNSVSSEYNENSLNIKKAAVEKSLEELLKKSGISFEKICIYADISENGSININQVEIICPSDEEFKKASDIIQSATGVTQIKGG